jgi:hypothetical protein
MCIILLFILFNKLIKCFFENEINLDNFISLFQEHQSFYDYKNNIYFLPVQFLLKGTIK